MQKTFPQNLKRLLAFLLALACALLLAFSTAAQAQADDRKEELQAAKEEAQAQLDAINEQIKQNQEEKAAAEDLKSQFEEQQTLITSQIGMLQEQIAIVENDIYENELAIEQKQAEIDIKQAEYDERWNDFKERMRAMQQLNDGGSIALLSSATNLYQLLTFAQTLEQITSKDQQICTELDTQRQELETQRAELEEEKATLEANQATLQSQNDELDAKRSELAESISAADASISAADAEAEALEAEEAEARKNLDEAAAELDSYLNSLITQYGTAAIQCSLDFGPALPSYKYISCAFGVGGHRGTDFAAPANTPIYAIGDGVVTIAGWHYSFGNYVQVYHGKDDDGNTYASLYAHMIQSPSVSTGQAVSKGDILGYVGSTGNSTGNHLHLELKVNGVLTAVTQYIPY